MPVTVCRYAFEYVVSKYDVHGRRDHVRVLVTVTLKLQLPACTGVDLGSP